VFHVILGQVKDRVGEAVAGEGHPGRAAVRPGIGSRVQQLGLAHAIDPLEQRCAGSLQRRDGFVQGLPVPAVINIGVHLIDAGSFLPRLAPGSCVNPRDLMLVPGRDMGEHVFGRPALQGARFCALCFGQGSDEPVFLRGRPAKKVE